MSFHTASAEPSTAATNLPVSSVGVPVRRAFGLDGSVSDLELDRAKEKADAIRAVLETDGRKTNGMVSAKTLGRWLETVRDAPVLIDSGKMARLVRVGRVGKKAAIYRVAV